MEENYTEEYKFLALALVHPGLKKMGNLASYKEDGITHIIDLDNNEVFVGDANSEMLTNEVMLIKKGFSTRMLYNLKTRKSKVISSYGEIKVIDNFIFVQESGIYNEALSLLYKPATSCRRFLVDSRDSRYTYCKYYDYNSSRYKTIKLDRETNTIACFDKVLIDGEHVIAVGVRQSDGEGYSYSYESLANVRYKLISYGKCSEKDYEDISKPNELLGTDLYMTYDIDDSHYRNKRVLKGIIDKQCTEVVEAIYDDIKHIGKMRFICLDDKRGLVKIVQAYEPDKTIIIDKVKTAFTPHQTLPIAMFVEDNQWRVFDYLRGEIYGLEEFTKKQDVSISKQDSDILRVMVGDVPKYIKRDFTPITSIKYIAAYRNHEWTRI